MPVVIETLARVTGTSLESLSPGPAATAAGRRCLSQGWTRPGARFDRSLALTVEISRHPPSESAVTVTVHWHAVSAVTATAAPRQAGPPALLAGTASAVTHVAVVVTLPLLCDAAGSPIPGNSFSDLPLR